MVAAVTEVMRVATCRKVMQPVHRSREEREDHIKNYFPLYCKSHPLSAGQQGVGCLQKCICSPWFAVDCAFDMFLGNIQFLFGKELYVCKGGKKCKIQLIDA